MQSLRFLAVSVIGVAVDVLMAWGLARAFGMPLWQAGLAGFAMAATLNYALHEVWTFRQGPVRASAARFLRHLASLGVTLAVRIGAILALEPVLAPIGGPLAVLGASVALSFCASYLVARFWVFRGPERDVGVPHENG